MVIKIKNVTFVGGDSRKTARFKKFLKDYGLAVIEHITGSDMPNDFGPCSNLAIIFKDQCSHALFYRAVEICKKRKIEHIITPHSWSSLQQTLQEKGFIMKKEEVKIEWPPITIKKETNEAYTREHQLENIFNYAIPILKDNSNLSLKQFNSFLSKSGYRELTMGNWLSILSKAGLRGKRGHTNKDRGIPTRKERETEQISPIPVIVNPEPIPQLIDNLPIPHQVALSPELKKKISEIIPMLRTERIEELSITLDRDSHIIEVKQVVVKSEIIEI